MVVLNTEQFAVLIGVLLAATAAMMIVRVRARLDSNWPPLYWLLMLAFALWNPGTWDPPVITAGAAASFTLRFEFLSRWLAASAIAVEYMMWAYVLYVGFPLVQRAGYVFW